MSRFLSLCGMIILVVGLTGCGRVSNPAQPSNSFYPHTYYITSEETNRTDISIEEDNKTNEQKGENDEAKK